MNTLEVEGTDGHGKGWAIKKSGVRVRGRQRQAGRGHARQGEGPEARHMERTAPHRTASAASRHTQAAAPPSTAAKEDPGSGRPTPTPPRDEATHADPTQPNHPNPTTGKPADDLHHRPPLQTPAGLSSLSGSAVRSGRLGAERGGSLSPANAHLPHRCGEKEVLPWPLSCLSTRRCMWLLAGHQRLGVAPHVPPQTGTNCPSAVRFPIREMWQ